MIPVYLKNFRRGLATNSSSTHSVIYRNENDVFEDLNIFELNYYDRCDNTIAATRDAKIKYVLANIFHNDRLTEILSHYYPEMKQYFPLIKKRMEKNGKDYYEAFGMYSRGSLYFDDMDLGLETSIDYIRNIIENPEIVIIGGSDEDDWVYDKEDGHVHYPTPEDVCSDRLDFHDNYITKNGNYYMAFGHMNYPDEDCEKIRYTENGRIRFMTYANENPIPEMPELVDLKITNKCSNGCKFCFADSTPKGKHADIKFLKKIIDQFGTHGKTNYYRTEFSIGGGNILTYPHLEELFSYMKEKGHIINITINAKDVDTVKKNKKLFNIIEKYVNGVGISIVEVSDIDAAFEFDDKMFNHKKHAALHLIPEYLGFDKTLEIMDKTTCSKMKLFGDSYPWSPAILFLGYKEIGRADGTTVPRLTDNQLNKLFTHQRHRRLSIDTSFAKKYEEWIKANMDYKYSITWNEGEYSMFIDGVTEKAYKSSYQTEKPLRLTYEPFFPVYNVKTAFAKIREDNGLPVFNAKEHNEYWNK